MQPADVPIYMLAFIPPIVYLWWVRNLETYEREPWLQVLQTFALGAIVGYFVAIVVSRGLHDTLDDALLNWNEVVPLAVLGLTVLTPLAEEPAKALALLFVRDATPEPEDGLVYGAAAGLGFAAAETVVYLNGAVSTGGFWGLIVVGTIRSFSSAFLHAGTTALVGYGFLRALSPVRKVGFLALGMVLHAGYNGLLSADGLLGLILKPGLGLELAGLIGALGMSTIVFSVVHRRVRDLDAESAPAKAPPPA